MEILEQEHAEPLVELWLREDQIDLLRMLLNNLRATSGNGLQHFDYDCREYCQRRAVEITNALNRGEKKEKP